MTRSKPGRRPSFPIRRRFLRDIAAFGLCAAMPLVSGCARSASRPRRDGRKILIVGAGISGLSTARSLVAAGFAATVLEARDRIGGRIFTSGESGAAVDMGASWIHGRDGNPITSIAREHGFRTFTSDFDDIAFFDHDGSVISEDESGYADRIAEKAAEIVEASDEDISVSRAFALAARNPLPDPKRRRILDNYLVGLEVMSGGDIERLSARSLDADDGFSGSDLLFPEGYAQVVNVLADGIDVRLKSPVTRIAILEHGVKIETADSIHEAEAVVVTLPLGVLKRGGVLFDPELPAAKRTAIERLGMGVLNKVALRFPNAFWPKTTQFFEFAGGARRDGTIRETLCATCHGAPSPRETPGFAEFLNMVPVNGDPTLVAMTGGPFGHRIESWSDERIGKAVMETIRRMFGADSPDPSSMIVSRWHTDPFAGGAYPHVPLGATLNDLDVLAQPVGVRLFFAGDATTSRYPSTVHGAYLSGQRAAREVAEALE